METQIKKPTYFENATAIPESSPLNASEICKTLGGGGHAAAAGASVKGSLSEVKEKVLAAVGNALEAL